MNSLRDWSDVIALMSEQSQKRDSDQLKELKEQVVLKCAAVSSAESKTLVEDLRKYAGWGSHDPRQTVEMQKYVEAVEGELLKRLGL